MPSSLRLRLFTARLFLALITSGSLWLRLFPARLLSAFIKPGSLRLLPALITSGSLRLRLFTAQLLSTPAHTARYYIYLNIYAEPGKAYSDTSKVLYKEKDIYNLLRKKIPNQILFRRPCRHIENSTIAWSISLLYRILSGRRILSRITNSGVTNSELSHYPRLKIMRPRMYKITKYFF